MQETGRVDCLSKGKTACSEDDNSPQEVVEVLFSQNAGTEKEDDRDDSDHAHVAKDTLELMADTPQHDSDQGGHGDEPLNASETILHRPDGDDGGVASGTESDEEKQPDQYDRNNAHWKRDEEPDAPARCRVHVLKSDQVLRRCDRGCGTSNIASQGNSQEKCLCHVGVGRQVAEDWLTSISEEIAHAI